MAKSQSREHVEKEIRRQIRSGHYISGQRLPSERELSAEFGVSRATIQGVIESLISTGFITQEPRCRPVVARQWRTAKPETSQGKNRIAVWIQPDLQDIGAAMILQGIRTGTERRGYSLVVGFPTTDSIDDYEECEVQFLKSLVDQPNVAGAIVWETCAPAFPTVFPALHDVGLPIVFVDREPPEQIEADVVSTNNRRGAMKAVSHLVRLGHRNIAMICNDEPASSVRDRIEGYLNVLRSSEIPFRPELLVQFAPAAPDTTNAGILTTVRRLLSQTPPPTAIFCVNDGIALRVQQALYQTGIHVPEDISLVGFDWQLRSLPSGGELTTVAQPFEAIGRIAAERLLERIHGSSQEPPRHILLEAPLVVKATTGPPPAGAAVTRNPSHASVQL